MNNQNYNQQPMNQQSINNQNYNSNCIVKNEKTKKKVLGRRKFFFHILLSFVVWNLITTFIFNILNVRLFYQFSHNI